MDQGYNHSHTSSSRSTTTFIPFQDLPLRYLSYYLYYKDPKDHHHHHHSDLALFNARHSFHLPPSSTTTPHHRLSSVSSTDTFTRNFRSSSFHSAPTPSSHSGLLPKPPPPPPHHPSPPSLPRRRFSLLCSCPCSGSKSIDVEENPSQPRFPFPLTEPSRLSLDVFKPTLMGSAFPTGPLDDDVGSDASSDLFEIESFPKRRDSVDGSAACRLAQLRRSVELAVAAAEPTTEAYAPSEASVEWSVTTAEGFEPVRTGAKKRRSGLLACVCDKAVSVGPDPVRFGPDKAGRVEVDRVREIARLVRSNSARICRPLGTRLR